MAFVGNTMADNDTVKVEIDPAAAYQNQDNVDFEITITANGPMHDSEIQITVPDGLSDLQRLTLPKRITSGRYPLRSVALMLL